MTEDQDNAGEVVAGAVRVALTAAGQLAEQAARRREAALREAERDSATRAATLQSQLAADRELALRSVRDVLRRGDATVEEVVHAWEQACSWDAPTMAAEKLHLENRIRERYALDPSSLAADRSAKERFTAAAVAARDVELQVADAHQRGEAQNRVAVMHAELSDAGINYEAASARALSLESHPTNPNQAAQTPQASPAGRPRGARERRAVEVQSPGR